MEIDLARLITAPQFPSSEPWEASLAELVRGTGKVPRIATKPLGLFDRFGAVKFGPDEVGFDNDEVPWDKVTQLRTWKLSSLLTGQGLEREVDRIRGYIPPIPGRKWAVEKTVSFFLDLVLAVSGEQAKLFADYVDGVATAAGDEIPDGTAEPADCRVVAEIEYQGALRKKEIRGGLVAALLLAKVPGANDCLCKWAEMKGVPVVPDEDEEHFDTALERGQALRARFDNLGDVARRLRRQEEPDPPDEPDAQEEPGPQDEVDAVP